MIRSSPPPLAGAGPIRALLWDVDGTLAETELEGHRRAFNLAFVDEGLPWRWDPGVYLDLLRISGGRERLRSYLRSQGQQPDEAQIERLQSRKQSHYDALVRRGAVGLRSGVLRLIREAARAGLQQAIVTTSGRASVEALTAASPELGDAFGFWICGEDVERKKPDPQGYRMAIKRLELDPHAILAIEDSRNGLAAASTAGLPCLVTLSASSRSEGGPSGVEGFEAALAVLDGLGDPGRAACVLRGAASLEGPVTLAWLQALLATP